MRAVRRLTVPASLPEPLAALDPLAHNLRWTWHTPTRDLFAAVDSELWDGVGRPAAGAHAGSAPDRLAELAADDGFVCPLP